MKKAEAALEKMMGSVLTGATGAARSTSIAALGAILGIEASQKSIRVLAAKACYRITDAHVGVGLGGS